MIRSLLLAATFDADWYLRAYPWVRDEIAAGRFTSAIDHFRRIGTNAGCNPNCYFSEEWYRYTYGDVAESLSTGQHASGFDHFVAVGRAEERRTNAMEVDSAFYLERYGEVAGLIESSSYASVLDHYILAGARSGFSPHPAFDEAWYLQRHGDVRSLVAEGRYISGYHHFLEHGLELGLQPHPLFGEAVYRALNPDVDLDIRLGREWFGFFHLQQKGLAEGREWQASSEEAACSAVLDPPAELAQFDPTWYWQAHHGSSGNVPLLSRAESFSHYRNQGVRQGLDPNLLFSEAWYSGAHDDVRSSIADGTIESGFEHFVRSGCAEGRRPCSMAVEETWYRGRYRDGLEEDSTARELSHELLHYLLKGARMGRDPSPVFDEAYYLRENPDVAGLVEEGLFLSGFHHFLEHGIQEKRRPHAGYSEEGYLKRNPDVREAVRCGQFVSGFHHLVGTGLAEGRVWNTGDDTPAVRSAVFMFADLRLTELLEGDERLHLPVFEKPEVSVVLVLKNRAELTLGCLESLLASRGVTLEVIVVDNASDDRTSMLLRRLSGFKIIQNRENVGFIRAANKAAQEATGEYLLFLNNDAEVFPTAIKTAVERLRNTEAVGAVGGRVVGPDGSLQEAGCVVWSDGSTVCYGDGEDPRSGAYLFPRRVDYCSGVFLLTRRESFAALNGFDERYCPAYYEDVDYCYRLREAGLEVVYEPGSLVFHLGQGSLGASWHVYRFTERNRPRFQARHASALATAAVRPYDGKPSARVAMKDQYRGHILFIDDLVPLQAMGSGFPRAAAIIRILCELGYFVTFFGTNQEPFDHAAARQELPEWGLELHDAKRSNLKQLLAAGRGTWDAIVVSRSHNLKWLMLRSGFKIDRLGSPIIYDCEALFSERLEGTQRFLERDERPEPSPLVPTSLDEDLELASVADAVVTVSESDAGKLRTRAANVVVVSHVPAVTPTASAFEARKGLLFVGRLDEPWNPNVDALRWFLGNVLDRVRDLLGEQVVMTVVGKLAAETRMPRPPGVEFLGRVADLAPLYESARIFVAPSRFGAGIPLKIIEAAAAGVPVVASSLLARQLGWQDGEELMVAGTEDPAEFADRCAQLYSSPKRWHAMRAAAQRRIGDDHSDEAFCESIQEALSNATRRYGEGRCGSARNDSRRYDL